MTVRTFKHPS